MMVRKGIRKILAISLILSMIPSAILVSYVSAQAQKPSYSIGNKWEYRIEYLDSEISGTITREIVEELSVTIDAEEYECFKIKVWQLVQIDETNSSLDMNLYLLKSDLSVVKSDFELVQGGNIQQITNITYSPPLKEIIFPMDVGDIWWANATKTETVEFPPLPHPFNGPFTKTSQFSQNFSVVRRETVTVPAGTFDTFVIEYETPDVIYEEYYSSMAGGSVRESVYDKSWNEKIRIVLIDYNYAPPGGLIDWWIWLVIGIVAVVIVVSAIFLIRRGKRPSPTGVPEVTPSPTRSFK
ncbi:MAG: hypothetical protein ACUVTD_06065 [Nitrososphaerales archaeon]